MTTDAMVPPAFTERRAGPLRAAVFNTVRAWDDVESGDVGGCPAFLVDDRPFAIVTDDGLALTGLNDDDRARVRTRWSALTVTPNETVEGPTAGDRLEADGGHTDERLDDDGPTDGRPVEGWPLVPIGGNDLVSLRRFIRLSYDGARAG